MRLPELYARVGSETLLALAVNGGVELRALDDEAVGHLSLLLQNELERRWSELVQTLIVPLEHDPLLLDGLARTIVRAIEADARLAAHAALERFVAGREAAVHAA